MLRSIANGMSRNEMYQTALDAGLTRGIGISHGVGYARGWTEGIVQTLRLCIRVNGESRFGGMDDATYLLVTGCTDPMLLEQMFFMTVDGQSWSDLSKATTKVV